MSRNALLGFSRYEMVTVRDRPEMDLFVYNSTSSVGPQGTSRPTDVEHRDLFRLFLSSLVTHSRRWGRVHSLMSTEYNVFFHVD